jgi:hypothetical protein
MRKPSEKLSDQEIERRMNAAVRRALNTPPQPRKAKGKPDKDKRDAKRSKRS